MVSATSLKPKVDAAPLLSHNVFQVDHGFDFISKEHLEVTEIKGVTCQLKLQIKSTTLIVFRLKLASIRLNTIQGRIFSRKIINITEEELLESLKKVAKYPK